MLGRFLFVVTLALAAACSRSGHKPATCSDAGSCGDSSEDGDQDAPSISSSCPAAEVILWTGDPPTSDCVAHPPAGYYWGELGCTKVPQDKCCTGDDCDSFVATKVDCLLAHSGCQISCGAVETYDAALCAAAPDVAFCAAPGRQADIERIAPGIVCMDAPSETCPIACRYHPDAGLDDCGNAALLDYNWTICALWVNGLVTRVKPIPLD